MEEKSLIKGFSLQQTERERKRVKVEEIEPKESERGRKRVIVEEIEPKESERGR